jgi:hypothetical protein
MVAYSRVSGANMVTRRHDFVRRDSMKRLFMALGLALATACDSAQEPSGATGDPTAAPGDAPAAPIDTDENFDCRGTVRGTFANVFVPAGATCSLQRSTVNGNVLAREGSRLYVSDTRVAGNIDGVEARVVQVKGGSLGGSIQIADGSSAGELGASVYGGTVLTQGNIQIIKMNTGSIRIADVRLEKGNIKVEENSTGSGLEVVRNSVAQNIQVNKNRGSGRKAVRGNRVFQIVQCKENTSPFVGGPNAAAETEGQCF